MLVLSEKTPVTKAMIAELESLDTASISDALDSLGFSAGLLGIHQQVPGTRCVGMAYTVQYQEVTDKSGFKNAANYIDQVPPGSVIVSCNNGRLDCTVWGDILTHIAMAKGIKGTVIDGVARDIDTVLDKHYPLFSRGRFMQSAKNRTQLMAVQVPVFISGTEVRPGDIIVCDASGCLVIPSRYVADVIERAKAVEETERNIMMAVTSGASLEEARTLHRYDQPWLKIKSKD
ncbi:RraA family protein [Pseudomonas viridiflava]|uniref:RraA family protein n=1 Tax=Pseudomonas syringae group TaxID=136849 RepID=UPI000F0275A1|nr:RraA family protein [Pseudomonas viridiflava]MCQ9390547.1 RraA family protein [Pseudomonas viridiflava]